MFVAILQDAMSSQNKIENAISEAVHKCKLNLSKQLGFTPFQIQSSLQNVYKYIDQIRSFSSFISEEYDKITNLSLLFDPKHSDIKLDPMCASFQEIQNYIKTAKGDYMEKYNRIVYKINWTNLCMSSWDEDKHDILSDLHAELGDVDEILKVWEEQEELCNVLQNMGSILLLNKHISQADMQKDFTPTNLVSCYHHICCITLSSSLLKCLHDEGVISYFLYHQITVYMRTYKRQAKKMKKHCVKIYNQFSDMGLRDIYETVLQYM